MRSFIFLPVFLMMWCLSAIQTIGFSQPLLKSATDEPNPLLPPWQGGYNGLPPFDKVKIEFFKPAILQGMAEKQSEIDAISNSPSRPTFENTILAMERSGKTLSRVLSIYSIWESNMNSELFQPLQREMSPIQSAFNDGIRQNPKLFSRIKQVYNSPLKNKLTKEQQRLVWKYYTDFVSAGANLNITGKRKVAEINKSLAVLFTNFSLNLLHDEGELYLEINSPGDLEGLPQELVDGAAAAAETKNKKGSWLITNTRSSIDPFLTYSARRNLREKAWKLFTSRGDNGDSFDNKANIVSILKLRKERATLLGFPTHAHWRMQNTMAKTPANALELMENVWKPAVAKVHEEVADMQALADKEHAGITIEPWDYRYYAEKVRLQKYDLDQNEVKKYMQLDKLRDGMFWVAGELFGYKFIPLTGIPVFHSDVNVWQVNDRSGRQIGLWYFDPYARKGKRSGAWMVAYRQQEKMDKDITTIVSNNSNFVKGNPGEPVLISWDDARTLFHEFGHALHGLSSNVTYPSLSGTSLPRDFVEFPSQLLERWFSTPEVLQNYALHYQTGQPIPQALVEKINKAAKFNQGFATSEYLASALIDMKFHLAPPSANPAAFEKNALAELGMPRELVMRHRPTQFSHIFSSDNYSAGYYGYLWSDVLSADAYAVFTKGKGPYDKAVAARLYKYVFSVGNSVDQAEAYRGFSGHDPKTDALMENRGFPLIEKKTKTKIMKTPTKSH